MRTAYNEFNYIIKEGYPKVASIQQQLSYESFKSIFTKYEWNDIMTKLHELEDWRDVKKQKSLSKILYTFLYKDKDVKPLGDGEQSSFDIEEKWHADLKEVDQYIKSVKGIKVWEKSKHSGSLEDKRHFIRQYLFWVKAFADDRYPKFKKLSPLTFEEAIKFEKHYIDFWGNEQSVEEFYYSPFLNKHTSSYKFLLEHTQNSYEED